jgi:hypothetical protein
LGVLIVVADDFERSEGAPDFTVGMRVRVTSGEHSDTGGIIVEDFGDDVGVPVVIGATEIAAPARRWAVVLDSGELKCLDSHQLDSEKP